MGAPLRFQSSAMHLRDRLKRLQDEGRLVGLAFQGPAGQHLARILRVGVDYLEFESCEAGGKVLAQLVVPLGLLAGVTVSSLEQQRAEFEAMLRAKAPEA